MRILHDIFETQLQEQLSFYKVGTRLLQKKIEKVGISLTEKQLAEIEAKLRDLKEDTITIQIDESQLSSSVFELTDQFHLSLDDFDNNLEEVINNLSKNLASVIPEIISELSQQISEQLKRDAPTMLKDRNRQRSSFEANLTKVWHKPFDLLEMFLQIALEAGDDFNREFRPLASQQQDYVFESLTRLHARACQIASEILVLLRSGYADGAHARWRSLHEVAVVGCFIKSHGNDLAERYLLHDRVESYKAASLYQQYSVALGYEPLTEEELNELKLYYQSLINRFGPAYKGDYGWAAATLAKPRPSFRDIEEAVGLGHLRPFYKLSSHNVHANPKGVFFKLGLYPGTQDILLAGPSNTGLADPGHGTAVSLAQITAALLTTKPNIDRLVICNVLMQLEEQVGDEFLATQKSLEDQEAS